MRIAIRCTGVRDSESAIIAISSVLSRFVVMLLCAIVLIGTVEMGYSRLLVLGGEIWPDYYLLRAADSVADCVREEEGTQSLTEPGLSLAPQDEFSGLFSQVFEDADVSGSHAALENCRRRNKNAKDLEARRTPGLKLYRAVDHFMLRISNFGRNSKPAFLGLLLFLCGLAATVKDRHISLRRTGHLFEHRVSAFGEIAGNLCLAISALYYLRSGIEHDVEMPDIGMRCVFLLGFSLLTGAAIFRLRQPPACVGQGGSIATALLTIPLYSFMAIGGAMFFFLNEGNPQAALLHANKMMEYSDVFLNVAVFIWVGMSFGNSQVGTRIIQVISVSRPSPAALAVLLVLALALPTAYTGASGVIVIAMGAAVYRELTRSGARRQLAMAATAMAGSTGVVLQPCLLVVLIAALNREVTTDQMFAWGAPLVLLVAALFFLLASVGNHEQPKRTVSRAKFAQSGFISLSVVPYVLCFLLVTQGYRLLFDVSLDELSAAYILPVLMLVIRFYEKTLETRYIDMLRRIGPKLRLLLQRCHNADAYDEPVLFTIPPVWHVPISDAASASTLQAGALLMLMVMSLVIGGSIESTELLQALGEGGPVIMSVWLTVSLMLLFLLLVGMFMEPFGAVVLVSGTLAPIAYRHGMDPLHFWMVTLVAFELGYVSPPVAVNHLLARGVIGEAETQQARLESLDRCFWFRHEYLLLPFTVLAIALLVVAYVPLLYQLHIT